MQINKTRKIEKNVLDKIDYKSLANALIDRMAEIDIRETREYLRTLLVDDEVRALGFEFEENYEVKVICEYYVNVSGNDLDEAIEKASNYVPDFEELKNFEYFARKV